MTPLPLPDAAQSPAAQAPAKPATARQSAAAAARAGTLAFPQPGAQPQPAAPQQPAAPAPPAATPQPTPPPQPVAPQPLAQQPAMQPVAPQPPPVAAQPTLRAPNQPVAPAERSAAAIAPAAGPVPAALEPEYAAEGLVRQRTNLTAAASFTLVALIVAMGMTYAFGTSQDTSAGVGMNPWPATFAAIGLAWAISIAHRILGSWWPAYYLLPVALLISGPLLYASYWQTGQEDLARSYLGAAGKEALIDVDAVALTSATIKTADGCFALVRERDTGNTTVSVATATPSTARQHADLSLAPRFAGRVTAGGDRAASRIFVFRAGQGPPDVQVPEQPALDC